MRTEASMKKNNVMHFYTIALIFHFLSKNYKAYMILIWKLLIITRITIIVVSYKILNYCKTSHMFLNIVQFRILLRNSIYFIP